MSVKKITVTALETALKDIMRQTPFEKITVSDITNRCQLNRQTFYYHFQDIPDLICYMIEQGSKELLENCLAQPTLEDKIRYLLSVALNAHPLIQRTISTSYQSELEPLLLEQFYSFFDQLTNESASSSLVSDSLTASQRKLLLRYHSLAFLGLVRTWSKDDSAHMDEIVHDLAQFFKNKTH
mgnify:CR=1 FL=1